MEKSRAPVTELLLELLDLGPFLVGQFALLDLRGEVVEPPLATLLGLAAGHVGGDERPVLRTMLGHQALENFIFRVSPVLRASVAEGYERWNFREKAKSACAPSGLVKVVSLNSVVKVALLH